MQRAGVRDQVDLRVSSGECQVCRSANFAPVVTSRVGSAPGRHTRPSLYRTYIGRQTASHMGWGRLWSEPPSAARRCTVGVFFKPA